MNEQEVNLLFDKLDRILGLMEASNFVALQDERTIVNVRAIDYITPWTGEDVGVAATVSVRGTEFEVTAADLATIERALGLHHPASSPSQGS